MAPPLLSCREPTYTSMASEQYQCAIGVADMAPLVCQFSNGGGEPTCRIPVSIGDTMSFDLCIEGSATRSFPSSTATAFVNSSVMPTRIAVFLACKDSSCNAPDPGVQQFLNYTPFTNWGINSSFSLGIVQGPENVLQCGDADNCGTLRIESEVTLNPESSAIGNGPRKKCLGRIYSKVCGQECQARATHTRRAL